MFFGFVAELLVRGDFLHLREAGDWALTLPDIIFAELLLMFGDLFFEFGEGGFGAAERIGGDAGGVHRSRRKSEIQFEAIFRFMRTFFEAFVQTNKFRIVAFEDSIQFIGVAFGFVLDGEAKFLFDVIVRNFHPGPLLD